MGRRGNINSLYELASGQWGLFTAAQAIRFGISRNQLTRMAHDGRIEPVMYGTYRMAVGEETSHTAIKAAWLSLYPKKTAYERLSVLPYDAIVTGRTAACLQGFGDFYESPYCFVITERKRTTRKELELLHYPVEERDIDLTFGIPSTTPERTLADLIQLEEDQSLVENYIEQTASSGYIFDEQRLISLLEQLRHSYGYENGATFARKLLNRNAIPAALVSSLSQTVRVLESSTALRDATELQNLISKSLPTGYEKQFADIMKAVQALHIPADTFAVKSAVSEQVRAISSLVKQETPLQTLTPIPVTTINAANDAPTTNNEISEEKPREENT